jgi:hypothetical protein
MYLNKFYYIFVFLINKVIFHLELKKLTIFFNIYKYYLIFLLIFIFKYENSLVSS